MHVVMKAVSINYHFFMALLIYSENVFFLEKSAYKITLIIIYEILRQKNK
jgi:hypothetical protein